MHTSHTHTGSHLVCVHGLDEHPTIESAEMRIGASGGREREREKREKKQLEKRKWQKKRDRIQERG